MTVRQWISKNFVGLLAIIIFLIFFLSTCGKGGYFWGKQVPDTVSVKTNTIYVPQPPVYIPQYIPQQTSSQAPIIIPPQYQPSADQSELIKQYQELVNKFLAQNRYKDSIILKDSTGKQVGKVDLDDIVSENKIKSRSPSYQLTFPHTTTTITIKEPYKPKLQGYLGAGLSGNQTSLVNGVDIYAFLKTKRDKVYGIKAKVGFNGKIDYGIYAAFKLKL